MGFKRKYYARTTQFKEINRFCNHLVHPPLSKKQYGETMTSWILLSPAVSRQKCGCFKLLVSGFIDWTGIRVSTIYRQFCTVLWTWRDLIEIYEQMLC